VTLHIRYSDEQGKPKAAQLGVLKSACGFHGHLATHSMSI